MEDIHGVDVSWLHHSNRERINRHYAATTPERPAPPPSPKAQNGDIAVATPPPTPPAHTTTALRPSPAQASPNPLKTTPKRPGVPNRGSSEKVSQYQGDSSKPTSRRNSWISNISSKFSSSSPQGQSGGSSPKAHTSGGQHHGANGSPHPTPEAQPKQAKGPSDAAGLPVPQQSKSSGSSFFSSALRRLSPAAQGTMGKAAQAGGITPRKVMNVDPNRPRCLVPDLDQNKLRRVAFCVDVEIAGCPRYKDDADAAERKKKFKDKKMKEKGEGEALKHPQQAVEDQNKAGVVRASQEVVGNEDEPSPDGTNWDEKKDTSRKKEKKKKSEEERKARKEEKRRKAEENGSVPIQIIKCEDNGDAAPTTTSPPESTSPVPAPAPTYVPSGTPRNTDRPTIDPLRIYRRCCQLRESPVLKRITEQLAAPSVCPVATPGVVSVLNLAGSRLQLADFVTLSDWLAIVPVKKLILEDAELTDEAVRVVLAGLLAARSSDFPRNRPHHQANGSTEKHEERSGIIEKLCLKNNPKLTKEGWKHIALFIYLCKSLKGLDVSMITFPPTTLPSPPASSACVDGTPPKMPEHVPDMSEIWSRSLSERLGGNNLEELIMAECRLTSHHIRKITDAVTISGLKRLGLAGNNMDDEAVDHIVRYIKSGVCQGLDLGGNDLRNRLRRLGDALNETTYIWALSLADCNLEPASLKPLLPALVKLPNLRFLDLSHNHDLFETQPNVVAMLRKYLPMMPTLKRIHFLDVAMSPAQAIAIAEILPECPVLAHINLLENRQLSALAAATEEECQEEAVALYASLMAAVRVSRSIICIDIDVPAPENSEVVRALAKQGIAYCLRNLEYITQPDHPVMPDAVPESLRHQPKDVEVPDILLHLVGYSEGHVDPHPEDPAPNNDYIVSGTGVVKALSYCLSEKATELQRTSVHDSGTVTPKDHMDASDVRAAKAKEMSKSLLDSAKKIRARLRPALIREAKNGDEMAYRRLLFLDNTLQGMIQRFEDEYPDVRTNTTAAPTESTDASSTASNVLSNSLSASGLTADTASVSAVGDEESDDDAPSPPRSRHASEVSSAAKALSIEEGQVHRLGQMVKHDLWQHHGNGVDPEEDEPEHLQVLREKLDVLDATELRQCVLHEGVEGALKHIGEKAEYFRKLQLEKPDEVKELRHMLQAKIHAGEGIDAATAVVEEQP